MTGKELDLTIIVPCYNESTLVRKHYEAVEQTLKDINITYQLIYIDDGSTDDTRDIIIELSRQAQGKVKCSVGAHVGKEISISNALSVFYNQAKYTIVMDVDFEDPPDFIPTLYKHITVNKVLSQVVMVRNGHPNQNIIRKCGAYVYYKIMNEPQGLRDYRIMSQSALLEYVQRKKCNVLKVDMSANHLPTEYIHYEPVKRLEGSSKWSVFSLTKLAIKSILCKR